MNPTALTSLVCFLLFALPPTAEATAIVKPTASNKVFGVNENVAVNTFIADMEMSKTTTSNTATWSMVETDCTNKFKFEVPVANDKTAKLVTKAAIDYETKTTYPCTLRVVESTPTPTTVSATFTVTVNNEFDVAPTFSKTSYKCSFEENVPANTPCSEFISVSDTEAGDTKTCSLSGPGTPGIFYIDSTTCQVKVTASNDRDTMATTLFQPVTITAIDSGGKSATATLTVEITDVNDNTPTCSTGSLIVTRGEDVTVTNYVVASFACTDKDAGANATMSCATTSTGFTASMTASTCSLKLSAALDYDTMSPKSKTAVVTVRDDSTTVANRRTATYSFTVSVTGKNEHTPVWDTWIPAKPASTATAITNVSENAPSGTQLFTAKANDSDAGESITYSINSVSGGLAAYFDIDSNSGLVKLVRSDLNREAVTAGYVDIAVKASDGTKSVIDTVRVTVNGVNEFDPVFSPSNTYSVTSLSENTPANTDVLTMTVTDADLPVTPIVCSITSGNSADVWQLKTGATNIVQTKKALAVDAPTSLATSYVLSISCEDNNGAAPKKSATATVSLSITSFTNDHTPTITLSPTSVTISETATTVSMATITAADNDGGTTGSLTCSISSPSGSPFITNGCSEIRRTGTLDFETTPSYSLVVQVSDGGSPTPKLASATLAVTVTNEDDNDPVCSSSPYSFTIAEGSAATTAVGKVTCTDADNPGFTYALVGVSLPFTINPSTGDITVSGTLDYDSGTTYYTFQATAKDNGTRGLTATAQVTVLLTPVNQATPTFTPATQTVTIAEDATVGGEVKKFTAVDGDATADGVVKYAIKSVVPASGQTKFNIDAASGSITLAEPLDYDAASFSPKYYVISVEGKDGGTSPKSSTGTLTVSVTNINDNTPVCGASTYVGSVAEDTTTGAAVTGGPVAATDGDGDTLYFNIASGDTGSVFQIGQTSGAVTRDTNAIDYETTNVYNLAIRVRDSTTASAKSATCSYRITITDVNEADPIFSPTSAAATKAENTAISTLLYTASATDADTSQTLTYGFVTASPVMTINSGNGQVRLSAALNYESATSHTVKITAIDSVATFRTATMTFVLTVTDVNEFTPVCTTDPVTATRNESTTGDLITFTCTDGDTTKTLVYAVASVNGVAGAGKFGFTSNKLVLNTAIDYETGTAERVNTVVTTVTDSGPGTAKTATYTSTVSILPVNEHTPAITAASGTVAENAASDTVVVTLSATDADQGSTHGTITWSIVSGNTLNYFKLVGNVIKVNLPPDRETAASVTLRVRATDGPGLFSEINVLITITDQNDNAPVFNPSAKTVSVGEDAVVGSRLDDFSTTTRVSDADAGTNAAISLSIFSGSDGKFALDTATSKYLEVAGTLNAATKNLYSVVIRAVDGGTSPKQTTDTTITINVLEKNDAAPVFGPTTSTISLPETTTVGAVVYDANATDTDGGLSGTVKFNLSSGDVYDSFLVQEATGKLVLKNALDYEKPIKVYFLVLHARDGGSPQKTGTMTVTVSVTDNNDNAPVFTSATSKSINENVGTGFTVMTVTATDADTGTNGQVEFFFDTVTTTFGINAVSGVITTLIDPDRETLQTHVLRVKATDKGTPKLTSYQTLKITINDLNDNTPTFPGAPFTIAVAENAAVGSAVTTVAASDNDEPGTPNSQLTYSLFPNDGVSDTSMFAVGSADGKITVAKTLNREAVDLYQYQILAVDGGSPPRTGTFLINITIADINDNAPVITGSPYTASVIESATKGTVVQQITATDADIGENKVLNYSFVSGNTGNAMKLTTDGKVVTDTTLDRETTPQYTLIVRVQDSGTPSLSSTATVTVNVLDYNDNAPSFGTATTTRSVAEGVAVGTNVGAAVVATDRDIGTNAVISYIITSITPQNHFSINSASGQLQVSHAGLDRETYPQYVLKVEGRDNGVPSLTGTVTVTVAITDINDNIPTFIANYTSGFSLPENSAVGTVVANVTATDKDLANNPNTNITYAIDTTRLQGSRASLFFAIDSKTGIITVKSPPDREVDAAFSFYVNATDAGVNNLRSSTIIYITITDVNDNAPIFNPAYYNAEMVYNDIYGTIITTIKATDLDSPGTANSQIGYRFGENAIYLLIGDATGVVTRNSAQQPVAGMKLLYVVVAEDKGSPTQRAQTTLRVDVHDPVTTVVKVVLSLSQEAFGAKLNQITASLRATLLSKYPQCIVRYWRSEVTAFTNTVARRLLQNGVSAYYYALADNSTDSAANSVNAKTFITGQELLLYWRSEASGTPTPALRGSAFSDTPVVSVHPYPSVTTTPWYQTAAGIAGLTVGCAVVLVLLGLGIFFGVRYCNRQRYKTLRVTRLDDRPYVTDTSADAKRRHPVPQYQIKDEKVSTPPSYERAIQSPPQGTGVYHDKSLWVGAAAAAGGAGAVRAVNYARAPSVQTQRDTESPRRLIRTGYSPANDARGPTPVELNF